MSKKRIGQCDGNFPRTSFLGILAEKGTVDKLKRDSEVETHGLKPFQQQLIVIVFKFLLLSSENHAIWSSESTAGKMLHSLMYTSPPSTLQSYIPCQLNVEIDRVIDKGSPQPSGETHYILSSQPSTLS